MANTTVTVIAHGGAGAAPNEPQPRQVVLDQAAAAGRAESTVVDAVEAAVKVLESAERFNAGVGGAVQSDGVIRTDAGVMTSDREAGAVCSMPGVEHAVSVARAVMEETPHVLVSGEHAVALAEAVGVETDVDLWTERSSARWDDLTKPEGGVHAHLDWIRERFGKNAARSVTKQSNERNPRDHDTVGAVATDGRQVAAATSTGGRWLALAGRVGDVPQLGCGFYCAPAGGASATGAGEDIAKTTLSRRAVRHLESGATAQEAADRAIEEFAELTGSQAGVIVSSVAGETGAAFNSEAMQTSISDGS